MTDLACRWANRPEHFSRIAADAARDTKWDDGVRALPTLSPREQAAVTAARRQLVPNPLRSRPMKPGNLAAGAHHQFRAACQMRPGHPVEKRQPWADIDKSSYQSPVPSDHRNYD